MSADDYGTFVFPEVPSGVYMLLAEATGFVPPHEPVANVTIRAADLTGVEVRLERETAISGRVTDAEDRSLSNATVSLYLASKGEDSRLSFRKIREVNASRDGKFEARNLEPGGYLIGVRLDARRTKLQMAGFGFDWLFPGTPNTEAAQQVTIARGEQLDSVLFRVAPGDTVQVQGSVRPEPRPVGNERVVLEVMQNGLDQPALSMPLPTDGTFMFDGVPANSTLMLRLVAQGDPPPGSSPHPAAKPITISPRRLLSETQTLVRAEDSRGIVLLAPPPPTIGVEITGDQGWKQAEGRSVDVTIAPAKERLGQAPTRSLHLPSQPFQGVIDACSPISYDVRVTLRPDEQFYVESMTFNGQSALSGRINLSEGIAGLLLIDVRSGGARIHGFVKDSTGAPAAWGRVVLIPSYAFSSSQVPTDLPGAEVEKGTFKISQLRPGDYYAIAVSDFRSGNWSSASFLALVSTSATRIRLESSTADISVSLDLISVARYTSQAN